MADLSGRFLFANSSYCALLGRDLDKLCQLNVADVTHAEDVARDALALQAVARGQLRGHQIHKRYLRPDNTPVEAWTHVAPVSDEEGRPVALIANVVDTSGEAQGTQGSLSEERSFRLLFAANPQPMWIYDLETLRFLEVNDAACTHYGYTRSEFQSRTIEDIRPPEDVSELRAHLSSPRPTLRNSGVWRHCCADGRLIEVEVVTHEIVFDGRDAVLVTIQDITERSLLERQLMHQALHDPLTGLPNRALFLDRLSHDLAVAEDASVGVLYIDLDRFQLVNDGLGHEAGDGVLAAIGTRLADRLPNGVTVGRIADDEFAISTGCLSELSDATALAHWVQALITEPLTAPGGTELSLSACVGVKTASGKDVDPAMLLRDAAIASSQAKQVGAGEVAVLDEAPPLAVGRLGARHALREAIESGQIVVHYQPVVALRNGAVVGVEALARWAHPERGLVPPSEFIPLAEETGLVRALGCSVLEQACSDAARFCANGARQLVMSVNVSGHQLRGSEFPALVRQVLSDTGLDPACLALEMTETVLIGHGEAIVEKLAALRSLGVHLSLDDFGTGYSSLTYLDRLPFDIVKIDRSFVTGMEDDPRHRAIVASVIDLALPLGLSVVAEGVENEEEAIALLRLGAQLAQGYHFFAPMPAASLQELLDGRDVRRSKS